jgi:cytochrome c-type biogenesis protein CcmE
LFAGLIVFLLWNNLSSNLVFYLTPSEAVDQRADFEGGDRFRLGGLVEVGSVATTANGVSFRVTDGGTSVAVNHTGTPPQLFQEDVGVVVEGSWSGDSFNSDLLLVRHDEQYRAPEDGEPAPAYPTPES